MIEMFGIGNKNTTHVVQMSMNPYTALDSQLSESLLSLDAAALGWGLAEGDYYQIFCDNYIINRCIMLVASLSTQGGFETIPKPLSPSISKETLQDAKDYVDTMNHKVNLDNILHITQLKQHIFGRAAWEIAGKGDKTRIRPLTSTGVIPKINANSEFDGLTYLNKPITKDKCLYFVHVHLDPSNESWRGISSIQPIKRNLMILDCLQRDLLQAARSLWAPMVIHSVDTTGLTKTEAEDYIADLKSALKPGQSAIVTARVTSEKMSLQPDLQSLNLAMEHQEEAIIGNWGIPKALLSKEKTVARATLEHSIEAFYRASILGEQRYLAREIETQWYDQLLENQGYDDIRIRHVWKPIVGPESELIKALNQSYKEGAINVDEWFRMTGYDLNRIPEEVKEDGKTPNSNN